MTAAKDNETLDHLLSVVNDQRNVRDLNRIAKLQDGRAPRLRPVDCEHRRFRGSKHLRRMRFQHSRPISPSAHADVRSSAASIVQTNQHDPPTQPAAGSSPVAVASIQPQLTSWRQFATVRIRHHHSRALPTWCARRMQRAINARRSLRPCPRSIHRRGHRRN
jgi:hypothetical protein